jgi:hypothetical protein
MATTENIPDIFLIHLHKKHKSGITGNTNQGDQSKYEEAQTISEDQSVLLQRVNQQSSITGVTTGVQPIAQTTTKLIKAITIPQQPTEPKPA